MIAGFEFVGVSLEHSEGSWLVLEQRRSGKRRHEQLVGAFDGFHEALAFGHEHAGTLGVLLMVTGGAA